MKVLRWLKDYWYIPALVLGAVLFWIVFRRRGNPLERAQLELKAIDAGRRAEETEARLGADLARGAVERRYHDTIQGLDEAKRAKAEELKDDPKALAKFLVRAGAGD